MKKILLLSIVLISSCSKDEVVVIKEVPSVVQTCNVEKYTEVRTIVYNNSGNLISDSGFKENGAKSPYSKNCEDCGKTLTGGYSGTTLNVYTEFRYIAKCK